MGYLFVFAVVYIEAGFEGEEEMSKNKRPLSKEAQFIGTILFIIDSLSWEKIYFCLSILFVGFSIISGEFILMVFSLLYFVGYLWTSKQNRKLFSNLEEDFDLK